MRLLNIRFRELAKRAGHRMALDVIRKPRALLQRPHAELRADLELVAAHLTRRREQVYFVQVGANDGELEEPFLHIAIKHGWQGVLVEPQTSAFQRLVERVADVPGMTCRNVAIDHDAGERVLYRVREDAEVPRWALGLASFDREQVLRSQTRIPGLADLIVEERVQCVTFDELLHEARLPQLDVLQVDTEGYDFEILKMADLSNRQPLLVNYEHANLSPADWNASTDLLLSLGYRVAKNGPDTIAYRFDNGT